jgi:hypothetical protein
MDTDLDKLKHMAGINGSAMITTANGSVFLEDLIRRLKSGGTVNVSVTLKGPNVFEYQFHS